MVLERRRTTFHVLLECSTSCLSSISCIGSPRCLKTRRMPFRIVSEHSRNSRSTCNPCNHEVTKATHRLEACAKYEFVSYRCYHNFASPCLVLGSVFNPAMVCTTEISSRPFFLSYAYFYLIKRERRKYVPILLTSALLADKRPSIVIDVLTMHNLVPLHQVAYAYVVKVSVVSRIWMINLPKGRCVPDQIH